MSPFQAWSRWSARRYSRDDSERETLSDSALSSPSPVTDASTTKRAAHILRYGLTEIYRSAREAKVDLILVHGLNGDPERTWTSKENGVFWPRDILPTFTDVMGVRILTYGYDSEIISLASKGTGVSKDKIHNHAERLVVDLCSNRRIRNADERPIIFLAHSLGGLVVKRALIYSTEITGEKTDHLRSIAVSTFGVLFLGTPHRGSDLGQWGSYLEAVCRLVGSKKLLDTQPQLIQALRGNSEILQNIDRQFSMLMDRYHLYFFHEGKPTNLKGTLRFIVEEESAAPTYPDVERACIQTDHSSMCKFSGINSPGFDLVADGIQRYALQAPETIRVRWLAEVENRYSKRLQKAKELIGGSHLDELQVSDRSSRTVSPLATQSQVDLSRTLDRTAQSSFVEVFPEYVHPHEPLFIVPPGFRRNSIFVGRSRELKILAKEMIESEEAGKMRCALVYGQPGVGKTSVVNQFIFQYRERFPGGIFWINSHSINQLEHDFWLLTEKVISKDSPESMIALQDPSRHFSNVVCDWFRFRKRWLLVFDEIDTVNPETLRRLQRFLSYNSTSNIIYVSRSNMLDDTARLFDPLAIKVSPLKRYMAQEMLLKELRIDTPRSAQIVAARDLAMRVGGLPLAIKAIARRTATTHVPLEKQKDLTAYSKIPELLSIYTTIIEDLKKHNHHEALNLLSILCFFGPTIPVELIHLGLKAIPNIKLKIDPGDGNEEIDLTFTIAVLLQYALVERNDQDDTHSMSSSEHSLQDPELIDVLKMHTVLQKFWIDRLISSKDVVFWLQNASRLFMMSYQEARKRLQITPELARISDYKQYSVHLEHLRGHTRIHGFRQDLEPIRKELNSIRQDILSQMERVEEISSQELGREIPFKMSIFDRTNTSSSVSNKSSVEEMMQHSRSMSNVSPLSKSRALSLLEDDSEVQQVQLMESSRHSTFLKRVSSATPTITKSRPRMVRNGSVHVHPPQVTTDVDMNSVLGVPTPTAEEGCHQSGLIPRLTILQERPKLPPKAQSVAPFYWPWQYLTFDWNMLAGATNATPARNVDNVLNADISTGMITSLPAIVQPLQSTDSTEQQLTSGRPVSLVIPVALQSQHISRSAMLIPQPNLTAPNLAASTILPTETVLRTQWAQPVLPLVPFTQIAQTADGRLMNQTVLQPIHPTRFLSVNEVDGRRSSPSPVSSGELSSQAVLSHDGSPVIPLSRPRSASSIRLASEMHSPKSLSPLKVAEATADTNALHHSPGSKHNLYGLGLDLGSSQHTLLDEAKPNFDHRRQSRIRLQQKDSTRMHSSLQAQDLQLGGHNQRASSVSSILDGHTSTKHSKAHRSIREKHQLTGDTRRRHLSAPDTPVSSLARENRGWLG